MRHNPAEWCCNGKVKHANLGRIRQVIKTMLRSRHQQRAERITGYKCPHCHTWHIGSE
jgi:hypothetical protein